MLEIDWGAERPSRDAVEAAWEDVSFEPVDVDSARYEEFLEAMSATRPNGDARCCCLQIPDSPVIDWFAARNSLGDVDFFARLLGSSTLAAELEIEGFDGDVSDLTVESSLRLDGILAEQLVHGGSVSYDDVVEERNGAAAAKRLTEQFRDLVVEDRYQEVTLHRTRRGWCSFFGEPHWNLTLVCVDRRYRWVWILIATDRGPLETD